MSRTSSNKPDEKQPDEVTTPAPDPTPEPAAEVVVKRAGVTLTKGDKTVVAHKPGTVTRLKSQGWKVED